MAARVFLAKDTASQKDALALLGEPAGRDVRYQERSLIQIEERLIPRCYHVEF